MQGAEENGGKKKGGREGERRIEEGREETEEQDPSLLCPSKLTLGVHPLDPLKVQEHTQSFLLSS